MKRKRMFVPPITNEQLENAKEPFLHCSNCGVVGHTVETCELKKQGDREIKLETERRERKLKRENTK